MAFEWITDRSRRALGRFSGVQAEADIHTRSLPGNWVGKVAFNVNRPEEPLLSSMVTDAEGCVSGGFVGALVETYGVAVPDDLQLAAAEEREKVYWHFGARIPADGGFASFPRRLREARSRAKRVSPQPAPAVCPVHHLQLPLSGQCDLCD